MRPVSEYRNYSARARSFARALDIVAAPLFGAPGVDERHSRTAVAGEGGGALGPDERRSPQASPLRRILLIRPDHAGDLLMATPAIRALRRALPDARIDLLVSPWGEPAVRDNPDIDRILTIEATWFEPGRREGPDPSRLLGSLFATRLGRYDAAADLRGDFRSILIARASGASRRAGFSRLGLESLLTDCVPFDPALDFISRNHRIVSLLGAGPIGERLPVFTIPEQGGEAARKLLGGLASGRPILSVFPGTNRPTASWGAERFARVCRLLASIRPISIVIGGREADASATGDLKRRLLSSREGSFREVAAPQLDGLREGPRGRSINDGVALPAGPGGWAAQDGVALPAGSGGRAANDGGALPAGPGGRAAKDGVGFAHAGTAASGPSASASCLLDLTGKTDLAQVAAVIRGSSALLANDSGAAHLAVAVRTPAVAIFGPTDPATLWTWERQDRYVALAGPSRCARPCFRADCPEDHGYGSIAPERVASLLGTLMDLPQEGGS